MTQSSKLTYHNSDNNDAREMKFGSLDGGGDVEHTGVGFVEICDIRGAGHDFLGNITFCQSFVKLIFGQWFQG